MDISTREGICQFMASGSIDSLLSLNGDTTLRVYNAYIN